MIFPLQLSLSLAGYIAGNKVRGRGRFPLVLMIEPTFLCNLTCAGCGRIREERAIANRALTVQECLDAVDQTGAPVVSISGGEPLLHPDIAEIVRGVIAKKRFVYLCTNGIRLEDALGLLQPSPYFSFVLHLDGLSNTHDRIAGRPGLFDAAIAGLQSAKRAGFQVRTNTTVFKGADWPELEGLFVLLAKLGVDGMMVAPAFSYEKVDADIFLSREEIAAVFRRIYEHRRRFRFYNTPVYLEFLAGKRNLMCRPWSTPTRNPRGWKRPCYLITDGYCASFHDLMSTTEWERYGAGNDPRCANCMVHSGFEASAIAAAGRSFSTMWRVAKWNLSGS